MIAGSQGYAIIIPLPRRLRSSAGGSGAGRPFFLDRRMSAWCQSRAADAFAIATREQFGD
jgi:hypothetical protein